MKKRPLGGQAQLLFWFLAFTAVTFLSRLEWLSTRKKVTRLVKRSLCLFLGLGNCCRCRLFARNRGFVWEVALGKSGQAGHSGPCLKTMNRG